MVASPGMKAVYLFALAGLAQFAAAQTNLTGEAAALWRKAEGGKFYATAARLKPEVLATSDGRSFLTVWRATGTNAPRHWIVSLPGREGFATDDLAIWSPHLKGREVGLVSVQWWLGRDNARDSYYTPEQVYREIDLVLQKLGARSGTVMFHGFSRGSANAYAIAALDAGRGGRYFALNVASSGGVALDYPSTRAILGGRYGDHPLRGTRWVTAAGGRDPEPERDGIPAMRRTAEWLKQQGAIVLASIEDPSSGHGALVRNPANAQRVLDLFLGEEK
jgi:hypothetical protein